MKIREEEERKRQEEKRRREEEERKRQEEKRRQEELQKQLNVSQGAKVEIKDAKKVEKLKKHSGCPQGFSWEKTHGGWVCGGGQHFVTDEAFAAF